MDSVVDLVKILDKDLQHQSRRDLPAADTDAARSNYFAIFCDIESKPPISICADTN